MNIKELENIMFELYKEEEFVQYIEYPCFPGDTIEDLTWKPQASEAVHPNNTARIN
jgi:hypothetical protein